MYFHLKNEMDKLKPIFDFGMFIPAYPHNFGVQYTGFRLILRHSPLVSLLYDICKILTIMYDIVFVWQYLIIAHQNIRLVGAQWKGNSEMEPVLNLNIGLY